MFNAIKQFGNGTPTGGRNKNDSFRSVQTVPVTSYASIDMEKLPMDVEECCVSNLIKIEHVSV
jgi:hypothetical protein